MSHGQAKELTPESDAFTQIRSPPVMREGRTCSGLLAHSLAVGSGPGASWIPREAGSVQEAGGRQQRVCHPTKTHEPGLGIGSSFATNTPFDPRQDFVPPGPQFALL